MNDTVLQEAKSVRTAALSLTVTLWIRRTIEKVSKTWWCDPALLRGPGAVAPTTAAQAAPPSHLGAGSVDVLGCGRVYYRSALTTVDGHVLYDHDEQLHPYHLGPCPLLHRETECEACPWYVAAGPYRHEPCCAALVTLEEAPYDATLGLSAIKRAVETAR